MLLSSKTKALAGRTEKDSATVIHVPTSTVANQIFSVHSHTHTNLSSRGRRAMPPLPPPGYGTVSRSILHLFICYVRNNTRGEKQTQFSPPFRQFDQLFEMDGQLTNSPNEANERVPFDVNMSIQSHTSSIEILLRSEEKPEKSKSNQIS